MPWKYRHRRRRLFAIAAALVVAVVTVVGGAVAYLRPANVPDAGQIVGYTPPPVLPKAVFIGDSYAEGHGATPVTEGFVYLVAAYEHWDLTDLGFGGTGYIRPWLDNPNYLGRLKVWHPSVEPKVVVIEGGSNDLSYHYPVSRLVAAFDTTLTAARKQFPTARLVVMGPCTVSPEAAPDEVAEDRAFAQAAKRLGLPYIDPIAERWFTDQDAKRLTNIPLEHPNNAGYRVYAARFEQDYARIVASDQGVP